MSHSVAQMKKQIKTELTNIHILFQKVVFSPKNQSYDVGKHKYANFFPLSTNITFTYTEPMVSGVEERVK